RRGRAVEPRARAFGAIVMADLWQLYVIEYARSRNQPVATLIQGAYGEGTMELPFSFVLATDGERNVLVDCGFMDDHAGSEMAVRFEVPWWISPVRMLEA